MLQSYSSFALLELRSSDLDQVLIRYLYHTVRKVTINYGTIISKEQYQIRIFNFIKIVSSKIRHSCVFHYNNITLSQLFRVAQLLNLFLQFMGADSIMLNIRNINEQSNSTKSCLHPCWYLYFQSNMYSFLFITSSTMSDLGPGRSATSTELRRGPAVVMVVGLVARSLAGIFLFVWPHTFELGCLAMPWVTKRVHPVAVLLLHDPASMNSCGFRAIHPTLKCMPAC